ncbi:MAG: hypothetical protein ACJ75J_16800 [Cytophagaceae bacterium]
MKKIFTLPLILLLISPWCYSQKIDEKKLSFQYIQLPAEPVRNIYSYNAVVIPAYEDDINARKEAFRQKVKAADDQYNAEMSDYLNKVRAAEDKYNSDLDAYTKRMKNYKPGMNIDTAKPKKNLPPGPRKVTYTEETYSKTYDPKMLADIIKLEGYQNSTANALNISVTLRGFQMQQPVVKTADYKYKENNVDKVGKKYYYEIQYKHPMNVKAEASGRTLYEASPEQLNGWKTASTGQYLTEQELKDYWDQNKDIFTSPLQDQIVKENMAAINQLLNEKYGYIKKSREIEINVPKEKKISYDEYAQAYVSAVAGYNNIINPDNKAQYTSDLKNAIQIWEKSLSESNLKDKKARINEKVTAITMLNLAEAYLWLDDYRSAEMYLTKMSTINLAGRDKRSAEGIRYFMAEKKKRYDANTMK